MEKAVGDGWEEKLECMILKWSPETYLLKEHRIKSEEELEFSFSSQAGMLMRRFYKKYGLEFDELKKLKNVYLVYIEKEAIVSKITMEQEKYWRKFLFPWSINKGTKELISYMQW